ncbi:hypothetical protein [Brevifollis gellanilyticus]|uniref:Uncharacterized protein n=1 Tax=Brevifollis gellanilyticus TaxID=748831 RepID=A0A512MG98_9BACT|nr:hypothetical protein [Brevifollis gellanilyticus]GEP45762.1 hypothetical protein BGE01nite_50530 [Brevifollis gellanilyticus]
MMAIGMLSPTTDIEAITNQIYVEFEGVNDAWLKTLEVPKVAGGQIHADQLERVAMEIRTIGAPAYVQTCCTSPSMIVAR